MSDDEQLSLQRMLDRAHAAGVRQGLAAATRPEDQKLTEEYEQLKRATEQRFCDCESYDCRGECCGLGECSCSGALRGTKLDVILPDGTHRYWSTHCRHGNHDACSAVVLRDDAGNAVNRRPAQCRTCLAPCICPCHKPAGEVQGGQ